MLALPKSQKVYENPNFTEILLLSSTLSPPPPPPSPRHPKVRFSLHPRSVASDGALSIRALVNMLKK